MAAMPLPLWFGDKMLGYSLGYCQNCSTGRGMKWNRVVVLHWFMLIILYQIVPKMCITIPLFIFVKIEQVQPLKFNLFNLLEYERTVCAFAYLNNCAARI